MAKKNIIEFPDIGEGGGFGNPSNPTSGPLNPLDSKYYQRSSVRNPQISNFARSFQVVLGLRKDPGVDFTDLQEAVNKVSDQGGGTILVTPGTYPMTETVIMKRDVSIEGISPQQSIFDFSNMVAFTGDLTTGGGIIGQGILRENSGLGTIAVTNNSKTVTGTSTTFTTASAGDSIIIAGIPYKIDAIASATSLTLERTYNGKTITGQDYAIYYPIVNVSISKVTVRDGEGAGFGFFYGENISLEDVHSIGWRLNNSSIGYGVYPSDVYELFMKNVRVSDNESHGIFSLINRAQYLSFITAANNDGDGLHIEGADDSFITHTIASNNGDNGFSIESNRCRIEVSKAENNVNDGFNLTGDSSLSVLALCADNTVINNLAKANGGDGIHIFDAVSDVGFGQDPDLVTRNAIVANALIDNGGYGINIDFETGVGGEDNSGLTNNQIKGGNSFSGNTSGKVNDLGLNTKIASRLVALNPPIQVLSANPADTNWTDLDVTAETSADTYAVQLSVGINASTVARSAYIRTNGSAEAQGNTTIVLHNPVVSQAHYHPFTVAVDSGQIFEWSVNNADVTALVITVLGYWESTY